MLTKTYEIFDHPQLYQMLLLKLIILGEQGTISKASLQMRRKVDIAQC